MIYFLIGTKAQFIKMAPVVLEAEKQALQWCVIDMGQHAGITDRILEDFVVPGRTRKLITDQKTVADYFGAFRWLFRVSLKILRKEKTRREFFQEPGVVLVHGDTLSTLMGTLLARRLKLPTGLVEAGLTSGHLFSPFPEELIRRSCEHLADVLFPPDSVSAKRLEGRNKEIANTHYNTGRDAVNRILAVPVENQSYLLVTLHRLETLKSKSRLRRAVEYIESCCRYYSNIKLVLHPPTRKALISSGYLQRLAAHPQIKLLDLLPYPEFLTLVARANTVATDGGSVQEECSYLRKRCIVIREQTERSHGFGLNCILTSWQPDQDIRSLDELVDSQPDPEKHDTASKIVIDTLKDLLP